MTDNTPTTKQEEGGLVTLVERLSRMLPDDPAQDVLNMCTIEAEALRALLAAAPAIPPHNEEGLRNLTERLHQAADDIVSGATIFSDRVHGLLWEAADALERQALGDTPNG